MSMLVAQLNFPNHGQKVVAGLRPGPKGRKSLKDSFYDHQKKSSRAKQSMQIVAFAPDSVGFLATCVQLRLTSFAGFEVCHS
jgi:hypothetical protein